MTTPSTERAILAGGCFWGVQELVRKLPGVISTRVGYSGGDVKNATYRNHGTHAEAIEIIFNPNQISFRQLLEFFFQIHDPTTLNRQGADVGTQYRSVILYHSPEQREAAEEVIRSFPSLAASAERCASARTSDATTAKPLPASPARAASTPALSASKLVWNAMPSITEMISEISADAFSIPLIAWIARPTTSPLCSAS